MIWIDRILWFASTLAILCIYSLYAGEHHPWLIISLILLWFLTACRNLDARTMPVRALPKPQNPEPSETNPLEP